jgi:two-component system response regulator MprA
MDAGNPGFQAGHSMATVLIVDDDPKLLKMLGRTLAYEGFHVHSASNGAEALSEVQARRPDVVVLDWMMPGMDGLTVLERLRAAGDQTLVLMLTARDAVENRVEGLEGGADDYLVKPFAPAELLARIHALLRRPSVRARDEAIGYAGLRLDPATREVWRGERKIELTAKEFDLLRYLLRHPRLVLTRDQILQEVWGYDFGGEDNVLEVYVGYLRKKTEAGGEPRLIQTVRGVGYSLREEG